MLPCGRLHDRERGMSDGYGESRAVHTSDQTKAIIPDDHELAPAALRWRPQRSQADEGHEAANCRSARLDCIASLVATWDAY